METRGWSETAGKEIRNTWKLRGAKAGQKKLGNIRKLRNTWRLAKKYTR